MPKIREKPKMGKPKAKHTTPLSPKQAARVMAEKYRKQTELRAPDEKNATEQATEEITNTADYIANELIESVSPPRRPRSTAFRQRGNPLREKAAQNGSTQMNRRTTTAQTHPNGKEMTKQYHGENRKADAGTPSVRELHTMLNADKEMPAKRSPEVRSRQVRFAAKPSTEPKQNRPVTIPARKGGRPQVIRRPFENRRMGAAGQQATERAKKTAKTVAVFSKRAGAAVARALAAAVSALAAAVGAVPLVATLVIVIAVAAVASSPFGLFFATERSAHGTVSVSEAVAQVNTDFNEKLEELQTGYDGVVLHGQQADWSEVLAVFACRFAGDEQNGVDVATLDADRMSKLKSVFWDMTEITTEVEEIYHEGTNDEDGWTEYILHITVTPQTANAMRMAYRFTAYQNDALDELLSDRTALASLTKSLTITNADAISLLRAMPKELSEERHAVVERTLSLVGKVNYFWGGKSLVFGWDDRWGQLAKVTADGSSTTGAYRPYGLDCSGMVDWAFYNATDGGYIIGHGGGAVMQHSYCTPVRWEDAQIGDLAFYPDDEHVGIVAGWDKNGNIQIVHCASSYNNVVITGKEGFVVVGRPVYYTND